MKSGYVSIIGRPNVGKSTLLNALIKEKLAIISSKPSTTRNNIVGIYNEDDCQIVFVDTPGLHKPKDRLGKQLNKTASSVLSDVDLIYFLVDASQMLGKGDEYIINMLLGTDVPVILVLNKIDCLTDEQIFYKINEYKDLYDFAKIVPISALKKDNIERLVNLTKPFLKDNLRYYDPDMFTTNSTRFIVAEYVREKLFQILEYEIPYRITCQTTFFEETKDITNIGVDIIVDKDSLKKIVIGKQGERLKAIGIAARQDIEKLLGKQVYLELFVKTIDKWHSKERYLSELGLKENE